MIQNNNFSVLPFYDSLDKQSHRKSYAYNSVFPLISHTDMFIPFQVMVPSSYSSSPAVFLVDNNTGVRQNVTTAFVEAGFKATTFDNYKVLVFPAEVPQGLNLAQGQYYLELYNDASQKRFSDVFTVVRSVKKYLKLEWWDQKDLIFEKGRLVYEGGFMNKLFIDSQLGKPEYPFTEEGEERDGYFFVEKQISEKRYKFTFLAPEYLLDALRLVRLSDHVFVTDMFGTRYKVDTILFTPKWQTQGNLASVEVEFETDTVVKKLGNYLGSVGSEGPDFNKDYNNDFNIK